MWIYGVVNYLFLPLCHHWTHGCPSGVPLFCEHLWASLAALFYLFFYPLFIFLCVTLLKANNEIKLSTQKHISPLGCGIIYKSGSFCCKCWVLEMCSSSLSKITQGLHKPLLWAALCRTYFLSIHLPMYEKITDSSLSWEMLALSFENAMLFTSCST